MKPREVFNWVCGYASMICYAVVSEVPLTGGMSSCCSRCDVYSLCGTRLRDAGVRSSEYIVCEGDILRQISTFLVSGSDSNVSFLEQINLTSRVLREISDFAPPQNVRIS